MTMPFVGKGKEGLTKPAKTEETWFVVATATAQVMYL